MIWNSIRTRGALFALLALVALLLLAGCGGGGGGDQQAQQPPTIPGGQGGGGGGQSKGVPGGSTSGGPTVESTTTSETLKDTPFTLDTNQPVPPDFRAAYQRKALIVVGFFKREEGSSSPQGLRVDNKVLNDLRTLRDQYPQIEFYFYDIDSPGNAESSEDLGRGEYGTLATQLGVGFTPFVAMLAPRSGQYYIKNLFQGYTERGVLNQALSDLATTDVGG